MCQPQRRIAIARPDPRYLRPANSGTDLIEAPHCSRPTIPAGGYFLDLPKRSEVEIPRRKVTEYLLATGHPVGGPKARHFESRGYSAGDPEIFERSLREIAREGDVTKEEVTEWGTKYVVAGVNPAPDGNPVALSTVWMVVESSAPVLVPVYPTRRRS